MSFSGNNAASHDFTIVTALYDLGRETWPHFRRKLSTYLTYSIRLLALDVPLVVYIDERVEPFVRHFRQHFDHITIYKVSELSELPYYAKYRDRMAWVMHTDDFHKNNGLLTHPEGFSPEYNVLMNAKFTMLHDTVHENPFNSSYFYWLDMGYGHGQDVYPKYCDWTPKNIMDDLDRITYVAVNNVSTVRSVFQLYKQRVGPGVNGGFFGGSAQAVEDYYKLHHHVLEDFLAHNMVDDDQTIAVECFLRKPSLFNMVPGEWYDVFKLFH